MSETSEEQRESPSEDFREDASEASETRWLTTGEAAKLLGELRGEPVSESTVRRLADGKKLRSKIRPTLSGRTKDSLGRSLKGHRRVAEDSVHDFHRELVRQSDGEGEPE